jgi:hypothetical protein
MKNKKIEKINVIEEGKQKNILNSNTLFFLTDEQKKQVVGGQEELGFCRKGFWRQGDDYGCKCGYWN